MGRYREPKTPSPWSTPHKKNYEIPTTQKNAIRQSHAKGASRKVLQRKYRLRELIIRKVLFYPISKRARPGRTGPKYLLLDAEVEEIKVYCAEKWEQRILKWKDVREKLGLACSVETLARRLRQKGFHRCVAC